MEAHAQVGTCSTLTVFLWTTLSKTDTPIKTNLTLIIWLTGHCLQLSLFWGLLTTLISFVLSISVRLHTLLILGLGSLAGQGIGVIPGFSTQTGYT